MSMRITGKPPTDAEMDAYSEELRAMFERMSDPDYKKPPEDPNVEYVTIRSVWPILEKALKANDDDKELDRVLYELFTGTYEFKEDGSDVELIRRPALNKW